MGSGTWNNVTYSSHVTANAAAGRSTFDYSDSVRSGKIDTKVHDLLDPTAKAGDASPFAGKVMREVCVTAEHPNPTAIAIVLDVTGSNIRAATAAHAKLPQLFGLLQRKGFVEDPQINMCAVGDAYSDRVPLQVGQFESDNRIDLQLEAMYLEGNGGGQRSESYELAAYYLAHHTYLEPWHKQGRKGYAFFIGDEMPYDVLKRDFTSGYLSHSLGGWNSRPHTLESLTGDTLEADVPIKDIFDALQEQYEVFFLFQRQGSYSEMEILPTWRELLGENAQVLDDPNTICEFVAGLLAMREGGLDLDEVEEELTAAGFDPAAIKSASKTLAVVGGGAAKTDGSLDVDDSDGAERL